MVFRHTTKSATRVDGTFDCLSVGEFYGKGVSGVTMPTAT